MEGVHQPSRDGTGAATAPGFGSHLRAAISNGSPGRKRGCIALTPQGNRELRLAGRHKHPVHGPTDGRGEFVGPDECALGGRVPRAHKPQARPKMGAAATQQHEEPVQHFVIGRGGVAALLQPRPQRPAYLWAGVLADPLAVLALPAARVLIDVHPSLEVEALLRVRGVKRQMGVGSCAPSGRAGRRE